MKKTKKGEELETTDDESSDTVEIIESDSEESTISIDSDNEESKVLDFVQVDDSIPKFVSQQLAAHKI